MSAMDVNDDYQDDMLDDDDDIVDDEPDYDSDGMDDEDEDEEDDFDAADGFAPVIADKDVKKPYEVEFLVHSTDEIIEFQNKEIAHVAGILGCLPEHAATMLRQFKWNKERLIERYMEDPEGESEKAGVVVDTKKQPRFTVVDKFECPICCSDEDGLETLALSCGHRFCRDCYEAYLNEKIAQQGESRRIQCMEAGCRLVVDEKTVEMVVSPKVYEKYRNLLLRTFVDDSAT
ncbi:uncharacterized protein SPPG_03893 [Spizellomyces punctatus DAOM BR117]|uniref:RBR-type E3 ubiquitin transferase n=1 Tax=Spizellomyces punctatus (strain DAOM BR117) TaxID=645134 RepID=A0A0L0HIR3_SPIPD|nr:uncharacterized protein SPPG_03893 [Spizellomyces punctatus DAOM BR117]KND00780.1 hypothetical protein SPPG_03893 [Spizellomyces punctatus DAOM BR117]|eukprot:XP_016608819.1 hypothetical protein SPPG_03893 [Spizellomyces punctatus DAOM BR117]